MKNKIFAILTAIIVVFTLSLAACDSHRHDWSMHSNSEEHWQICVDDGEEKPDSRAAHFDDDNNGFCDECGYQMSPVNIDDDSHQHVFNVRYNDTEHWKECSCGQTTDHQEHSYADGSNKCVGCDYVKPDDGNAHTYVIARDATHHWQLCTHCGITGAKTPHTQQANYLCSCGYAYDAPASGNLQTRNFWIIGTFTDDRPDGKGWGEYHNEEWQFHRLLAIDSNGSTQYVFERQFSSGDEFKIVNDGGGGYWSGELNASNVSTDSKQLLGGNGGGNITFVGTNGYYRITVHYGSGNTTVSCERVYGEGVEVKPHEHSYAQTWTSDELGHWHASTCEHADLKQDLSSHVYDDKAAVCSVCGYTKPHQCVGGDWVQGKTEHWKNCTLCGKTIESTRAAHDGEPCGVCGYELAVSGALNLEYDEVRQGYVVTGYDYYSIETDVRIPSVYNNKPVVAIASKAFMQCAKINTVIVPDSVTEIEEYAFAYCSALTSVKLGGGVKILGMGSFEYTALTAVTLPNGLQTIGNGAFEYCRFDSVTIPASVTRIGSFAFRSSALQNVVFQDTVGWKAYPLAYETDPAVAGETMNVTDSEQNAYNFVTPNNPYMETYGYAQYIWIKSL